MKKVMAIVIMAALVLSSVAAFAQDEITVELDKTPIVFDVQPQIINDRVMVPMRKVFEEFGGEVDWNGEHQLIIAVVGSKIITMMINEYRMPVFNVETGVQNIIELDSPPVIIDGRTLVPVRAISEALGADVSWQNETRTVVITTLGEKAITESPATNEKEVSK